MTRIIRLITPRRGSAIITALVTMTVLILLGLAVMTLSFGNLKINSVDATNNDAYYAAEAGVNSAIEQLKFETTSYYNEMLDSEGTYYNFLYENFFPNITLYAQSNFKEPSLSGGFTTDTVFSMGNFYEDTSTCEFLVSSTSTAPDGSRYKINGKLDVIKVDVMSSGEYRWLDGAAAIKAGGVLNLESKNSVVVDGGNIIVGDLLFAVNNTDCCSITDGALIINQFVGDTINDKLTYGSYSTPTISGGTYLSSGGNINYSLVMPVSTAPNLALTFSNCTLPAGVMYVSGSGSSINISNCTINSDIYCDGNVTINNVNMTNGRIFCRGDVSLTNNATGGTIYCDGFVDFTNCVSTTSVYAQDGIDLHTVTSGGNLFSPKLIFIDNSTVTDNSIVYSSTKLTLDSEKYTEQWSGVFFSGGDIEFANDISIQGSVIAKNDIYFRVDANKDLLVNYNYNQAIIDMIEDDPNNEFFFYAPGVPSLNEEVIGNQMITAVGRVS